jgi:hypothetical protein
MLLELIEFCLTFLFASFILSLSIVLLVGMVYCVRMALQDMQRYFSTYK